MNQKSNLLYSNNKNQYKRKENQQTIQTTIEKSISPLRKEDFKDETDETNNSQQGSSLKYKKIGNFILTKTLGKGTFGKVQTGIHCMTQNKVAIKILDKQKIKEKTDIERIIREIKILKKLRHVNIVQLYDTISTKRHFYLITEFINGGDLFDYLSLQVNLDETEICRLYNQLINAIEYIHQIGIVHRDIKPENILVDFESKTLKLVDFGLSNLYDKGSSQLLSTPCGSPCYAAPEMIAGFKYNGLLSDIWSSGVVLYSMLCGELPFDDVNLKNLYYKITNGIYTIPSYLSDDAKDLIKGILTVNVNERYTIEDIKSHSWYNLYKKHDKNNEEEKIFPDLNTIKVNDEIVDKMLLNFFEKGEKAPSKLEIKENISRNKHNEITTVYYLTLNEAKRSKSIGNSNEINLKNKEKIRFFEKETEKNCLIDKSKDRNKPSKPNKPNEKHIKEGILSNKVSNIIQMNYKTSKANENNNKNHVKSKENEKSNLENANLDKNQYKNDGITINININKNENVNMTKKINVFQTININQIIKNLHNRKEKIPFNNQIISNISNNIANSSYTNNKPDESRSKQKQSLQVETNKKQSLYKTIKEKINMNKYKYNASNTNITYNDKENSIKPEGNNKNNTSLNIKELLSKQRIYIKSRNNKNSFISNELSSKFPSTTNRLRTTITPSQQNHKENKENKEISYVFTPNKAINHIKNGHKQNISLYNNLNLKENKDNSMLITKEHDKVSKISTKFNLKLNPSSVLRISHQVNSTSKENKENKGNKPNLLYKDSSHIYYMKNILNKNQKRNQLHQQVSQQQSNADSMMINKTYMIGNNSCSKRKESILKNEKNEKSISKVSQINQSNSESFSHYTGKINLYNNYNYSNKIKNHIKNEKEISNNSIFNHSNHENNKEKIENKEKLIQKENKKCISLNKSLVYSQLNTSSIHNQSNNKNKSIKSKLSLDNPLIFKGNIVKNIKNKSNFLDESLNLNMKNEKENSSFNKLQKNYILNSKFLKKGLNIRK